MVVNTYFKGQHDNRPPRWVRTLVFKCLAPMVCMRSTANEALDSYKVCIDTLLKLVKVHKATLKFICTPKTFSFKVTDFRFCLHASTSVFCDLLH